ncbi:MAG: 2TM domain-containing protein [Acidimicrobiales bacterium]|nr:2TM domain-containing protein [Acidimicrobiales bacterium]
MSALFMHTVVYVAVNGLLIACWVLFGEGTTDQATESFRSLDQARAVGFWPLYVIIFWGSGLLIHAGATLSYRISSRKRRKAKARKRREAQARLVGVVDGTVLADAALAGISFVDGEKAAKKVKRKARALKQRRGETRRRAKGGAPAARVTDADTGQVRAPAPAGTARSESSNAMKAEPAERSDTATADNPISVTAESASASAGNRDTSRRWAVAMFTDIVDSTLLTEALGDEAWAQLLTEHRRLVRQYVADHGGREVGTQGDGFLLRFDHPDSAVACAVALQRYLDEQRAEEVIVPSIRIGIHAGEVVHAAQDDDLVGRVVNLASRVTDVAAGGEILVTEPVADHLTIDVRLVDRGLKQLKGFDQPRHLLAIAWQHRAGTIVLESTADLDGSAD